MPQGKQYDFAQFQQPAGTPKITSIFDFTAEALEQLAFWIEQRGLHVPITQVLGFSQFTAQTATSVFTPESTTSTTYTDLATAGPTLSGLPDGKYVFFYGSAAKVTGAEEAGMAIQVNSDAVNDTNDACVGQANAYQAMSIAVTKTLSTGGNNTVTAKYHSLAGASVTFARRWLIAIRYANN